VGETEEVHLGTTEGSFATELVQPVLRGWVIVCSVAEQLVEDVGVVIEVDFVLVGSAASAAGVVIVVAVEVAGGVAVVEFGDDTAHNAVVVATVVVEKE